MSADIRKNPRQGTDLERVVARDSDMVLSALAGGQAQVIASLARDGVAEGSQPGGQRVPRKISRQFHRQTTSS